MNPADIDIVLKADPKSVGVVPWAAGPTAQVIHDCYWGDGRQRDAAYHQTSTKSPKCAVSLTIKPTCSIVSGSF